MTDSTRLGRDQSVGQQDALRRAAKLRQEADELERAAKVEAQRAVKNRPVGDDEFTATIYEPPKASDIFKDKDDDIGKTIRDYVPRGVRRRS